MVAKKTFIMFDSLHYKCQSHNVVTFIHIKYSRIATVRNIKLMKMLPIPFHFRESK